MKQIIRFIITGTLFLFISSAFSQTSLIVGAGGGANLSKQKLAGDMPFPGRDFDGTISRTLQYQGGIDLGIQFGNLAILTGARYNQRGNKLTENRDDPNSKYWVLPDGSTDVGELTVKTKYNFISIPLMARYKLGQGAFKFSIALGPQFNLGAGKVTETDEFQLLNKGEIINEYTYEYGNAGDNLLKKSNVSFVFMPGIAIDVSPKGSFKVNMILESSGDMLNKSYLVNGGERKVQGSIKSRTFALEIGYEHRLDFNVGVKY